MAHGVIGVLIAGMLAATAKPARPVADPPQETVLEISLMTDSLPLPAETTRPPVKTAPRTPAPANADDAPGGAPPPVDPKRKDTPRAVPDAPAETASTGDGSVSLGPSPFAGPARKGGLEGLASNDPCTARIGPKPKDCGTDWAGKMGGSDPSVMARSKEELARYYADFVPKCPYRVGCEGGEWISNQGTRSVAGTKMASGAAGLGGMNETVGRLGFNPEHTDPGFGD